MLDVRCLYSKDQASVVQKGDNVILWINRYPSTYPLVLIRWIVIYLVDNGIQSLNNRGQEKSTYRLNLFVEYQKLNRRLFSKHVYCLK